MLIMQFEEEEEEHQHLNLLVVQLPQGTAVVSMWSGLVKGLARKTSIDDPEMR